jgi:hypothetical protein
MRGRTLHPGMRASSIGGATAPTRLRRILFRLGPVRVWWALRVFWAVRLRWSLRGAMEFVPMNDLFPIYVEAPEYDNSALIMLFLLSATKSTCNFMTDNRLVFRTSVR